MLWIPPTLQPDPLATCPPSPAHLRHLSSTPPPSSATSQTMLSELRMSAGPKSLSAKLLEVEHLPADGKMAVGALLKTTWLVPVPQKNKHPRTHSDHRCGFNITCHEGTGDAGSEVPLITGGTVPGPSTVRLPILYWSGGCNHLPAAETPTDTRQGWQHGESPVL